MVGKDPQLAVWERDPGVGRAWKVESSADAGVARDVSAPNQVTGYQKHK
jgi:hypothetical protein